ncbi:thiamine phosphate synthase [Halopelagius longus]|uniref:Thiamine-phosphate synthase n=1 Tax=Halopelagius longus TaxID=1236180 RepID=A0A1H0YXM8_9EURY|nr:thiamine phosphate synthase [Halopelagius longus]RDI72722.1 thiamine phosphate synthase [Halopelagius longus]SDQ19850.1 thiamine-phosphate diphosphorylase [Halopelagius longus]
MNTQVDTYLVTQTNLSGDRSTVEVVRAAIAGGVDAVQLREKHATARERYELARELRQMTADAGVTFVVNDRVDIAVAADADGVHLGDDDLPVSVAREQLGPDAVVGRSVSTVEAARDAEAAGADYLGVGAVFSTSSKDVDDDEAEIGTETVAEIVEAVDVPVVGIGGITPENAADVAAAGADGVAVISAIAGSDDPEEATRRLATAVREGRASL